MTFINVSLITPVVIFNGNRRERRKERKHVVRFVAKESNNSAARSKDLRGGERETTIESKRK